MYGVKELLIMMKAATAVDTETFIHSSRMLNRNLRDFKVLLTVDSSLQY